MGNDIIFLTVNKEFTLTATSCLYPAVDKQTQDKVKWEMKCDGNATQLGSGISLTHKLGRNYLNKKVMFTAYIESAQKPWDACYQRQIITCFVEEEPQKALIRAVKGPNSAIVEDEVECEVIQYSVDINKVTDATKRNVKWQVKVDDKSEVLMVDGNVVKGAKIKFMIPNKWCGKTIILMPYLNQFTEKIAVKINISGQDLKIIHSGQVAELTDIEPRTQNLEPHLIKLCWSDSTFAEKHYLAKEDVVWLNLTTDNVCESIEVNIKIDFFQKNNDVKISIGSLSLLKTIKSNYTNFEIELHDKLFDKSKVIYAKANTELNGETIESDYVEVISRIGGLIIRGEDSPSIHTLISNLAPNERKGIFYKPEGFVFDMVKYTLTVEESKYLKLYTNNQDTHIDLYELIKAEKEGINTGGNYKALLNVCKYEYSELSVSSVTICYNMHTNKTTTESAFAFLKNQTYSQDEWIKLGGNKDFLGEIEYKGKQCDFTKFEQELIMQNGGEISGIWVKDRSGYLGVGLTLYPQSYSRLRYEKELKTDNPEKISRWCSINKFNQVIINMWMSPIEIVANIAHEVYGHLMFKVISKPNHSHTQVRQIGSPGCNDELEIQIRDRHDEAESNFKTHNE